MAQRLAIDDLGTDMYLGEQGGLYPGGVNVCPSEYLARGISVGQTIQPINGKVVLLATGMSNATVTFSAFKELAYANASKNPALVIVDGAQGGMGIEDWIARPSHPKSPWSEVAKRLRTAGVSASQVQAMWCYHADKNPDSLRGPFPVDSRTLAMQYREVISIAESKYANLKQVHFASMTYMGYSINPDRQEPMYGYDHQWSVKWIIEDVINRVWTPRSWIDWSVQQWCDGATPRSDGFTWLRSDVKDDGVHPSDPQGRFKTGQLVLNRYLSDQATPWFRS